MKDEHTAKAVGINLSISTKASIEISSFIRGKPLDKVKKQLLEVLEKKRAIPYKRFNKDCGHKPGKIAAGRYPIKAVTQFLKLVNSVEANANNKGLDISSLYLYYVVSNRASTPWHYGRKRRIKMKRTTVEIRVKELGKKKIKEVKKEKKIVKVPTKKKEEKKENKK
jgi:large subunit ribosomal protein L22